MEIEEFRPEPARPLPPEPRRKDRSAIIMSLIFVMTFLVTLAVQERHRLAEHIPRAGSTGSKAVQTSGSVSIAAPGVAEAKFQGNVGRAMACIPANVLSAVEIEQLNAAIAALPANSLGTTTKALSADSFDPRKMTAEQARETLQILVQIKGPLGDKALQALNQSISEGPCKIHADTAPFPQPKQQKPAPSPFL